MFTLGQKGCLLLLGLCESGPRYGSPGHTSVLTRTEPKPGLLSCPPCTSKPCLPLPAQERVGCWVRSKSCGGQTRSMPSPAPLSTGPPGVRDGAPQHHLHLLLDPALASSFCGFASFLLFFRTDTSIILTNVIINKVQIKMNMLHNCR